MYPKLSYLISKTSFNIAIDLNICFIKKKVIMYPKTNVRNCNCIHCKQKLEQIKRASVYWDKEIINKSNT